MALDAATSRAAREAIRKPWVGVELRHLAALAALAREGSFRGAADSLGYVQSAVSQQLAQLERVVQCRLVERERGSTRVVLTAAGELLLGHAERLLADLGAAHADLEDLAEGTAGRLRVGAASSLGGSVLARVLPGVLRKAPKLRVEVTEGPTHELAAQIAAGTLDAAFAELPLPDGPFVGADLCSYGYLLIAPPDAPSARAGRPPTVTELSALPLLWHPLMESLEPCLRSVGVEPRYALRCESLLALRRLVAAGTGCAIVPALAWDRADDEETVAVPLDTLLLPRSVWGFRHSERVDGSAAELLIDHAARVYSVLGKNFLWANQPVAMAKPAVALPQAAVVSG